MHKYNKYKIFLLALLICGCDKKTKKEETIYTKISERIEKRDWYAASKLLNLHINMKNSSNLHIMNGMVYDELSKNDPSFSGLSVVAYRKALNMDPNNWKASLLIGKYYLQDHKYVKAISAFAKTLVVHPNNPDALYGMANCAYATRNITLARNSIDKLIANTSNDPQAYRLAALIYASQNDPKANYFANKFANMTNDSDEVSYIRSRVRDWKSTHARLAKRQYAERQKIVHTVQDDKNQNLTVEFIILSFDEKGFFSKGNNFLDTLQEFKKDEFAKGLSMRFGKYGYQSGAGGNVNAPVYDKSIQRQYDWVNHKWKLDPAQTARNVTGGFTIGLDAIRYSLKLIDSGSHNTDIVARPIIELSSDGGEGSFNSGDKSYMNTGGDVGSAIANIPSGVKARVRVDKVAEQNMVNEYVDVSFEVKISKTSISNQAGALNDTASSLFADLSSNLRVKVNSTTVVGGVHSNMSEKSNTGVPGMKNIPIFDLVLANKNERSERRSVMIVMNVRQGKELHKQGANIDNMENIILLKEYQPFFHNNTYKHEHVLKNESHEYRRDDIVMPCKQACDEIVKLSKKMCQF